MNTFCISLPLEKPERNAACRLHFDDMGMEEPIWIQGFHADTAGLTTKHNYEVDAPGSGFNMGPVPTCIFLGHYSAWQVAFHLGEEVNLIMEDDVLLHMDWRERMSQALADVPDDFDILFLGSCDTQGKKATPIKGEIFEVKYPQCLHCYVVRHKALGYMMATQRRIYGPIDCTLIFHTYPALKVYTLLPRLADQHKTVISP